MNRKRPRYRKFILLLFVLVLAAWYGFSLPRKLFSNPLCTVIEDRNGNLLGARIANDGQWRFPLNNTIPLKFKEALIEFEDKRFYRHNGIDWRALLRATWQNLKARKIVSGGSTISMQVIRMSRKNKPRTFYQKIVEIILTTRLELRYSKEEILSLYISNAPFGGNVVGIDAASWRYFGRNTDNLSWAESATLAVLPNSPALIHPGKNRNLLKNKRNRLLSRLYKQEIIDNETYSLSIEEPIPEQPRPFPQYTPHLLSRIKEELPDCKNKKIATTIDLAIQQKVGEIANRHHDVLKGNQIHNMAAVVLKVETGEALAYIGNIGKPGIKEHCTDVDIITAPRSTGSILKPFLYAAMLTSGEILPDALIADIPTYFSGYSPRNFDMGYDGAVPASRALARSLNVPAIRLLQRYGVQRFHYILQKSGLTTINQPPDYYGLSLILGGCEGSLWDISGVYASMARSLNHYEQYNGQYNSSDFSSPEFLLSKTEKQNNAPELTSESLYSAAAIWLTFLAMLDVERPPEESNWRMYSSSKKIAWKTGTSFGFRDAWSIGVTPDYVVGVWTGNADGEGRPGLVGILTAAPVMFDIFDVLPASNKWFHQPYDEMVKAAICHESGYLASTICPHIDSVWIPTAGMRFGVCPYHRIIHLDQSGKYRVHSDCESPSDMQHKAWFILPPAIEWYYKTKNPFYKSMPPYRLDCIATSNTAINAMEIIYPEDLSKIYIPVELNGQKGATVFEIAHRAPDATIFWHVDDNYVGQTRRFHHLALNPGKGKHKLTLIDENGEKLTAFFEILDKE